MTLVTDVLDRIARQVSVEVPSDWLTASGTEYAEIRDDFLLETVEDISDRSDLPSPIGKTFTLTGTGAETYALPADFRRLQRDRLAVYESTTAERALTPITDDGMYTHIKETGLSGAERFFRITGYDGNWSISFHRAPATGNEIKIHYVSTNWKANAAGTEGDEFTALTDVLLLPRRVVEVGTVYRWRERKGLPFESKQAEYEVLLARLSNDSRNRRVINFGEAHSNRHPWDVPVPSEIPSS